MPVMQLVCERKINPLSMHATNCVPTSIAEATAFSNNGQTVANKNIGPGVEQKADNATAVLSSAPLSATSFAPTG